MLACIELVEMLRVGFSPFTDPLPLSLLTNHFSPLTAALAA